MSARIVPLAEEHIAGFHACLDQVARERRYLAFVAAPPLEATREFVRMSMTGGAIQLVALEGEEVVGWCDVRPGSLEGFTHAGSLGMGVRASHRGRGIGEALAREAIRRAREAGLERVDLEVFASNQAAVALYRKLGFSVEGTKERARRLDGAYDDIVLMARFMDSTEPER